MKLRYFATVVVLALTTVAANAQTSTQTNAQTSVQTASRTHDTSDQGNFGLYLNPIAVRASNSISDTGPYAFLGENSKSNVFYGYNLGGFYDFYHAGSLGVGFDMRFSDLHANNAILKQFMVGLRVSGQPFVRPFKPYIEAAVGDGSTKAPNSLVRASKLDYGVFAGVDYRLARHVDFRVFELGYGALTTVSTATVGPGGTVAIPAAKLISFSSGLVFRF